MDTIATAEPTVVTDAPADRLEVPQIEQDLLVEDVSIDGMCGVY